MAKRIERKRHRTIAYCLLPIAYCLLPIAYCLLLIAYPHQKTFCCKPYLRQLFTFTMKELPRREMLSVLIEKLQEETEICLYRLQETTLWEKFENGLAHFVVRNSQIVGCCFIWDDFKQFGKQSTYVELGTVWTQKQDRTFILAELGDNISRIAQGKKIMGFCNELKLARYFRKSSLFPVNKIADGKTCPPELIEFIPQFRGWSNDASTQNKYDTMLYHEDDGKITAWYIVYQS